jgi:capsule polysaccharide export protein KpsE/RkpR
VKTWSDYVAEAEQYRHYKQRCEQLEAEVEDWKETAQKCAFKLRATEMERDEAQQGAEYAIACMSEWQERCEQLEADLQTARQAMHETVPGLLDRIEHVEQRCEQLEAVYQAAETLVNQWASPDPDREAAKFAATAMALQRAVRNHRAERRALRLSGGDQR